MREGTDSILLFLLLRRYADLSITTIVSKNFSQKRFFSV